MSLEKFSKKRVLIVDELDAFRFSTKQALMSLGMKLVDTASTAQSVVSGFQNVNYDIVLCNYDLGKGKNGQQLLEELRYKKLLKFTGLFFIISAEVERGKVMGTLENEPDGYLVKPVTPNDLKQRLGRSLEVKEAMRLINEAIDDGDYRSALAYCDKRLADKLPYAATCSKTRAWLLTKLGKLSEAENFYKNILADNDYTWAEYGLAKVQIKARKYDEAEVLLNHIIDNNPDYIEAMDQLAELYQLRGKPKDAQNLVKQALERSPNSLLRQKQLADLCIENKDTEGATEAFKQVIKLGDQSVYAKPEQYYDFAEFLADESTHSDDEKDAQSHASEAFKLLEKAKKRFSSQAQIETQTKLVSTCLTAALGDESKASEELNRILEQSADPDSPFDADTLQVAAKALKAVGRDEEAEEMLEQAADLASNDSDTVSDIYDQLNQDITSETRQRAAAFNKNGIRLYNDGKIEEAAKELRMAVPLTPRHISLNLNLIQVLLKLDQTSKNSASRAEIERYMHKVRHIPPHHYEYPRYEYLKARFEKSRSPDK